MTKYFYYRILEWIGGSQYTFHMTMKIDDHTEDKANEFLLVALKEWRGGDEDDEDFENHTTEDEFSDGEYTWELERFEEITEDEFNTLNKFGI